MDQTNTVAGRTGAVVNQTVVVSGASAGVGRAVAHAVAGVRWRPVG